MDVNNKIENYLITMELPYEEPEEGTWIVYESDTADQKIVIRHEDSIVYFRLKVMEIPENINHEHLFRTLLELNATSIMHGAFAIEHDAIVLIDTLQAENIDLNEFEASIDSLFIGALDSYKLLSQYKPVAV